MPVVFLAKCFQQGKCSLTSELYSCGCPQPVCGRVETWHEDIKQLPKFRSAMVQLVALLSETGNHKHLGMLWLIRRACWMRIISLHVTEVSVHSRGAAQPCICLVLFCVSSCYAPCGMHTQRKSKRCKQGSNKKCGLSVSECLLFWHWGPWEAGFELLRCCATKTLLKAGAWDTDRQSCLVLFWAHLNSGDIYVEWLWCCAVLGVTWGERGRLSVEQSEMGEIKSITRSWMRKALWSRNITKISVEQMQYLFPVVGAHGLAGGCDVYPGQTWAFQVAFLSFSWPSTCYSAFLPCSAPSISFMLAGPWLSLSL